MNNSALFSLKICVTMNIFEIWGTVDLECFNISLPTRDMTPLTRIKHSKEVFESSIEGVVEISFVRVPIYTDIAYYVDRSVFMTWA